MKAGRWSWALWATVGAAGLILAGSFAVWHPVDDPASSWCVIFRLTGIACPGCGLTRAVAALFHLDWAASLRYHPLAGLVVLQLVLAWALWGLKLAGRFTAPRTLAERWVMANLAALTCVWFARAATGTLPW